MLTKIFIGCVIDDCRNDSNLYIKDIVLNKIIYGGFCILFTPFLICFDIVIMPIELLFIAIYKIVYAIVEKKGVYYVSVDMIDKLENKYNKKYVGKRCILKNGGITEEIKHIEIDFHSKYRDDDRLYINNDEFYKVRCIKSVVKK